MNFHVSCYLDRSLFHGFVNPASVLYVQRPKYTERLETQACLELIWPQGATDRSQILHQKQWWDHLH